MWYFTWLLGVLLACAFGIINALWLEAQEGMDQQTAVLDPLTKLPARVEFLDALEQALNQYRLNKSGFALLLVGLNKFKQLSEQDDSTKLDQTVLTIAQMIKQETRPPIDFVCRYDAATFVILLPAANISTAKPIAGRICEQTESSSSPLVSIGVVEFPADVDFNINDSVQTQIKQLLQLADKALTAAQQTNTCICAATELKTIPSTQPQT